MERTIEMNTGKAIQGYAHMKYNNLKLVYDVIRERRSISRIDLARETGMSATSMTRICSELISTGLIREGAVSGKRVGRRAMLLEVCPRACFCFCINIDVCTTQLTIFDMLLDRVAYREICTEATSSYEEIIDEIATIIPQMAKDADVPMESILAVGISTVGSVHEGVMQYVAQFNWSNVPAQEYAQKKFGLPVMVENDCKAALIGEQRVRYGINCPANIVYIGLGKRGVGAAAMVNGQLLRGSTNAAGELGHITVQVDGMLCDCGRRGCLQTFLAEQFLLRRAAEIDLPVNSMQEMMDALANGDPRAVELFQQMNQYIGVAINIIACAYNPDVILFNDHYFLRNYHNWYKQSRAKMPYYIFRPILETIQVETSMLGSGACLYGIGCSLLDTLLQSKLNMLEAAPE